MVKIKQKQQKIIEKLAQKYSLELLLLFGSQVTGKTHKESDFDIAYAISAGNLDITEEGQLINELMPIFGVRDERLINLVNIKKVSPLFLYAITSNVELLYEKEKDRFASLRAYAFKKYIETKPLYKERERRLKKELAFV